MSDSVTQISKVQEKRKKKEDHAAACERLQGSGPIASVMFDRALFLHSLGTRCVTQSKSPACAVP